MSSATAAFLSLRLAIHCFTYSLVNYLFNPSKPQSSLPDIFAFGSDKAFNVLVKNRVERFVGGGRS